MKALSSLRPRHLNTSSLWICGFVSVFCPSSDQSFVILHSLFRSANSGSNGRCVLFIYFSLCDAHFLLCIPHIFCFLILHQPRSTHTHRAESTDRQSLHPVLQLASSWQCSHPSSPPFSPPISSRLIPFPYLASSHLCSAISSVSLTDILTLAPANCFSLHTWHISPLI